MHVLVCDDDQLLRELVRYEMEGAGHTVSEAVDGVEALAKSALEAPDVILLDLMMPRMDGNEVIRQLRKRDGVRPSVIVLSAKSREEDALGAFQSGADGYVIKPFVPELLAEQVSAIAGASA